MAQAKRSKLKVLPRALIRKLAREWAADFRERVENFVSRRTKKSVKKRRKKGALPTVIPITERELSERNEQKRLASIEFQRVRYLAARDEERRAEAELKRLQAGRGMSADELQTLYRAGVDLETKRPLKFKQLNLNREFERYDTSVQSLAKKQGIPTAIDTARFYGVHPDEWADDLAYDFDLDQSDLYEEFFYPSDGATTW